MESCRKSEIFKAYRPAVQELELIIGERATFEREAHEHGEIKKHLEKRGMEVMRQLFQCYLNCVSETEEPQKPIRGADGAPYRQVRARKRRLMSAFGPVEVWRLGYSDRGLNSVFPLGAQMNLPPQRYSHGLRERIGGKWWRRVRTKRRCKPVERRTGGCVPKRQAEEAAWGPFGRLRRAL